LHLPGVRQRFSTRDAAVERMQALDLRRQRGNISVVDRSCVNERKR